MNGESRQSEESELRVLYTRNGQNEENVFFQTRSSSHEKGY
jgi:hypothetical protein